MDSEKLDYLQKRAENELELAQCADNAKAVRAHYLMAQHYLDRVHGDGDSSPRDESAFGALTDEQVLRHASETAQAHGELAADYAVARIDACRTAGDPAGQLLWEKVLALIENRPIAPARS